MKQVFLFITLWALASTSCSKAEHTEPPKEQEIPKPEQEAPKGNISKEKVKQFFVEHLSGKTTSFQEGKTLSLTEIAHTQQEIWQSWKEANQSFSEEKLGDLAPLTNATQGNRWQLPANLEANAIMPFYWASKGNQPEKGYPLFVYMHGSGNKHQEWANGKILAQRFDDAPSAYFIPQIPNTGELYRWWQKSKQFAWEKLLRLAFLSGKVDANRVYFFGISEGGYGSQRLASFYADYLAGAGPMAGGEPLINAPVENCRNIAFSLRTGAKDNMFHRDLFTQYAKEEFEKFKAEDPQGFVHHIELIPNAGHGIDYRPTTPWLKQYTRSPHPKKVVWEDFPMDGIYRKGFYNIAIKERGAERVRYTMDIIDNKVSINVDDVSYKGIERSPRWNLFTKYQKTHIPLQKGKFVVYLNQNLVDFSKEVTVVVNNKQVFKGMLQSDVQHLVNSCATFFDPERVFPAAVEVHLN
ncbi:hypothetical protein [Capnocytophaga canis]|uniref:carboxylesterase family protein n=1 Tax=Capnocytophaga canis TaxID=1848903 RepID=UPI0015622A7C|nr:hypothetical protein [Capnocytophaga canis]